jgi:hypothetical protein
MISTSTKPRKHIVCYSGGHSSALVAIEVVRKFGNDDVILVNHDLHFSVEDPDIKRFKREVAAHLGSPITFASHKNAEFDQFDVCVQKKAFKVEGGSEFCTSVLKTVPFMKYLNESHPAKDVMVYYGFDANEQVRITRRVGIMGVLGYATEYPLATWTRTIFGTEEIGIARPRGYSVFKHGNCVGCLKAKQQHWYIVYCTRPDIWMKAKWAEEEIGYSIIHTEDGPLYLEDLEPKFEEMRLAGVPATELIPQQTFWAQARKFIKIYKQDSLPCECST